MPSISTISIDKLARLVGTPKCPVLIDVQTDEDFAADPRLIPGRICYKAVPREAMSESASFRWLRNFDTSKPALHIAADFGRKT